MIMHTRSIWLKEKVQIFIILFEKEYNKGSLFVAIEFSSSKDVLNWLQVWLKLALRIKLLEFINAFSFCHYYLPLEIKGNAIIIHLYNLKVWLKFVQWF